MAEVLMFPSTNKLREHWEALPGRPNPARLSSFQINQLLDGIEDPEIFEQTCEMIERGDLLPYSKRPPFHFTPYQEPEDVITF
jgi:hypothetical protein